MLDQYQKEYGAYDPISIEDGSANTKKRILENILSGLSPGGITDDLGASFTQQHKDKQTEAAYKRKCVMYRTKARRCQSSSASQQVKFLNWLKFAAHFFFACILPFLVPLTRMHAGALGGTCNKHSQLPSLMPAYKALWTTHTRRCSSHAHACCLHKSVPNRITHRTLPRCTTCKMFGHSSMRTIRPCDHADCNNS